MKTGTSFLQHTMGAHRPLLREHGVVLPKEQPLALSGILQGTPAADAPERRDRVAHRLIQRVTTHPGQVSVLSWEFLSFLDRPAAQRLLDALSGADTEVVLAVRDAARTMPAQWQTTCRNGSTVPWHRFPKDIGDWLDDERDTRASRIFRRTQDIPRMLEVWSSLLGPERVHVVTVSPARDQPMLLWDRFARAARIPGSIPLAPAQRRNPSLGYPSSELLRLINVALSDDTSFNWSRNVIRPIIAPDLEALAADERPVRLGPRGIDVAARWNQRVRASIEATGSSVFGDLDDLPEQAGREVPAVKRPDPSELLSAAATVRETLLGLGAGVEPSTPSTVEGAVAQLAAGIRDCRRLDLGDAKRARGRGRW